MNQAIEVQILKAREGWIVNLKIDGRAEAVYGYFGSRSAVLAAGAEFANAARAGQMVKGSLRFD